MAGLLMGELPALPLHEAGKYVAGAYIVAFVIVLIYVAIMAIRLSHIERELGELLELTDGEREQSLPEPSGHDQLQAPGRERTPA